MAKNIIIITLILVLSFVSLMYLGQRTMYINASCSASELLELSKIDYEYINHMNSVINKKVAMESVYKQILTLRERRSRLINSSNCSGEVERKNEFDQNGNVNTTTLTEMVNNKNIDAIMDLYTPKAIPCGNYPKSKTGEIVPWDVCKGKAKGQVVEGYDIGFYESSAFDLFDKKSLREILTNAITDKFFKIDHETNDTLVLVSIDNSKEKVVFVSPEKDTMKGFSGFFFQGFNPLSLR